MSKSAAAAHTMQVTPQGVAHRSKGWADTVVAGSEARPASADLPLPALVRLGLAPIRAQLRQQAETLELATMNRLRETRQLQGTGLRNARLGVRVRDPRRPGGSFTIEWYRVRRRGRTDYIARGDGDAYGRKAFIGVQAWERAIALEVERTLGEMRRRLRLMTEIERRVATLHGLLAPDAPAVPASATNLPELAPDAEVQP
jgi:hypothetical protein